MNCARLEGRERGKLRGPKWYGYSRLINHNLFGVGIPRLVVAALAKSASFAPDYEGSAFFTGGGAGVYGLMLKENSRDLRMLSYLFGLLNSRYLDHLVKTSSSPFRGGFYIWRRQYLEPLPIPAPNFSAARGHESLAIVSKVEEMLALQQRLDPVRHTPCAERDDLFREITRVDQHIDGLFTSCMG